MYSDKAHIVDMFNDAKDIVAHVQYDGVDKKSGTIYLALKIDKDMVPDETGTLYVHLTDGVQHKRIQVPHAHTSTLEEVSEEDVSSQDVAEQPTRKYRKLRLPAKVEASDE